MITINIAKDAPIPKCRVPGRCWGDIIHNKEAMWLASYKSTQGSKPHKYI